MTRVLIVGPGNMRRSHALTHPARTVRSRMGPMIPEAAILVKDVISPADSVTTTDAHEGQSSDADAGSTHSPGLIAPL